MQIATLRITIGKQNCFRMTIFSPLELHYESWGPDTILPQTIIRYQLSRIIRESTLLDNPEVSQIQN